MVARWVVFLFTLMTRPSLDSQKVFQLQLKSGLRLQQDLACLNKLVIEAIDAAVSPNPETFVYASAVRVDGNISRIDNR